MNWLFEPGFFSSGPVHVAVVIGGVVAIVSSTVGVFTVTRGQSFAGHSLADVSTAGGSGAFLLGMNPLLGFIGGGVIGAGVMEMIGVRRASRRDLATGVVLGASIGLAALFLYLGTTSSSTTGASQEILFGSIFSTDTSTIPVVVIFSVLCLLIIGFVARPLLLASVDPDIAAAAGVPVRVVGLLYMLALALAVGLSALAIGAILSTALLIGPAAIALRLTKRTGRRDPRRRHHRGRRHSARGTARVRQLRLEPSHQAWPVSFFIVALVFFEYLLRRFRRSGHTPR